MAAAGDWDIIEVVGNWDDGTAQKVTADAIAVHSEFVGVVVQGGTTGAVRAMLDADQPPRADRRRVRERLPEAPRRARSGRAERAVGRAVAGARCRDRDQGRARRPRWQRHAAADLGADPVRPLGRARGRQELLAGPDRQLLHRQRVPAVRGEHPGQGHHGRRPPTDGPGAVSASVPADGASHLRLAGITKRYGGVTALDDVDFACELGSIHAVLGENGAGKSTLIKTMAGRRPPRTRARSCSTAGRSRSPPPAEANAAGIVCIFQELSLLPDLSVADNISIAAPPRRFGLIDRRAQRRRAEELLARIPLRGREPHLAGARTVAVATGRWSRSPRPSGRTRAC